MRRPVALLAVAFGVLGLMNIATAQQTPTFTRPAVTVRTGAIQTVNAGNGGLAPYVEAQSMVHLGKTPVGMALYGGLSYERSSESYGYSLPDYNLVCAFGTPPCGEVQKRLRFLDLTTGVRLGIFPRYGPVNAFVGVASHFVHRAEESSAPIEGRGGERWSRLSTVEAGISAHIPVTSRLSIGAGLLGLLPVHIGERRSYSEPSGHADEFRDIDMNRLGFHVGVWYDL